LGTLVAPRCSEAEIRGNRDRMGPLPKHPEGDRQAVAGGDRRDADDVLVAALAAGCTKLEAARLAGVGERTVYRRLDDPQFRRRIEQARAELVSQTVGRLTDASTAAVTTLRALLDAESENVRLGASRAILELGRKLRESEELERRLAVLEERAAGDLRRRKAG
jgi:hypothetical protein